MSDLVVYDKLSWHYPEGKGCPGPEAARAHFEALVSWLRRHDLLTPFGREVVELGIASDFALSSDMLTDRANRLLAKHYGDWLSTVDYGRGADMTRLDAALADLA